MGTRINIYVGPEDGQTCAILYCNNSHEDVDPESIVSSLAAKAHDASDFVRKCAAEIYPSDKGNNRKGEPVFPFDTYPGDYEYVLHVVGESCGLGSQLKVVKKRHPAKGTLRPFTTAIGPDPAILPCPFCGQTPDIDNPATFVADQGEKWGHIICCCAGPEVRTDYKPLDHWRQAAIDAWNERTN